MIRRRTPLLMGNAPEDLGVAGLYNFGPNLLTHESAFNKGAWVKSTITVSADAATAPDGAITAWPAAGSVDKYLS